MKGSIAFGAVIAKNYLAFARVLARSLREHHPDIPLVVLLCDRIDGAFDRSAEEFEVVTLEDLHLPNLQQMRLRCTLFALLCAAKPLLLRHLLERGFERAIYVDADVLVLDDLTPAIAPLDRSSILLTPHLLSPLTGDRRAARELHILRAGVYNGGFIGVANKPDAHRFVRWWEKRLSTHCRHDIGAGMHFDQRWMDLVPAMFDDVAILRDPASNVAYWNLAERDVSACRFFHFSGFRPDEPDRVTRHDPSLTMNDVGAARSLFERYSALLQSAGFRETSSLPYAYSFFDNGEPIPDVARALYAELGGVEAFGDPVATAAPTSFFHFLAGDVDASLPPARRISRLWHAVYHHRPDLQNAFPDYLGADRDDFLKWTIDSGRREHGMS